MMIETCSDRVVRSEPEDLLGGGMSQRDSVHRNNM